MTIDTTKGIAGLKGALRYVRAYRDQVFVVKLGGEVLGEPEVLDQVTAQLALLSSLSIRLVVVHGRPLPAELAIAAETRFACEVRELFGSTETCVIARRRSAREQAWTPLPGVRLQPQPDGSLVHAPHLHIPVALADLVELVDDDPAAQGHFHLRGRQADLLEIAGKRASLGDLTRQLQAVPGVVDAVMFQLDATDAGGVRRIAALAVAPGLDEATILRALRRGIDPVFLPRPLKCVAALPRNDTGKLPRAALLSLLQGAPA